MKINLLITIVLSFLFIINILIYKNYNAPKNQDNFSKDLIS